jgi:hypothetical protein
MNSTERIRREYEAAAGKQQELTEQLKRLEDTVSHNFHQIWMMCDQIAYWEGKSEGLKFVSEEIPDEYQDENSFRRFWQRVSVVSEHHIMNNNYVDPHESFPLLIKRYHLVYPLSE